MVPLPGFICHTDYYGSNDFLNILKTPNVEKTRKVPLESDFFQFVQSWGVKKKKQNIWSNTWCDIRRWSHLDSGPHLWKIDLSHPNPFSIELDKTYRLYCSIRLLRIWFINWFLWILELRNMVLPLSLVLPRFTKKHIFTPRNYKPPGL